MIGEPRFQLRDRIEHQPAARLAVRRPIAAPASVSEKLAAQAVECFDLMGAKKAGTANGLNGGRYSTRMAHGVKPFRLAPRAGTQAKPTAGLRSQPQRNTGLCAYRDATDAADPA